VDVPLGRFRDAEDVNEIVAPFEFKGASTLDRAPPKRAKPTGKLEERHDLDFARFCAEVKRALRAEIPLKERGEGNLISMKTERAFWRSRARSARPSARSTKSFILCSI
jgi:hypothetical protein